MKNWKRLLRSLPREAEGLLRGLSSTVPRRGILNPHAKSVKPKAELLCREEMS
jgi:hypothetical protein